MKRANATKKITSQPTAKRPTRRTSEAYLEAKRHIYRCLMRTLLGDFDEGGEYIFELIEGHDESRYIGVKLKRKVAEELVREIAGELEKKSLPKMKPQKEWYE